MKSLTDFIKLNLLISGKVMDIQGGSTKEGAKIIQYPDNGGQNQQWFIVEVN
ncbi:MAG: RICIN domain-containing protein [Bacteroidales bacterium]|nr:RICIN domain-containing protein [Bacteroidales bacterium]